MPKSRWGFAMLALGKRRPRHCSAERLGILDRFAPGRVAGTLVAPRPARSRTSSRADSPGSLVRHQRTVSAPATQGSAGRIVNKEASQVPWTGPARGLVATVFAAVTFLALVAGPPASAHPYFNSSEAGCDGSDPNVLMCDDFEDGTWF